MKENASQQKEFILNQTKENNYIKSQEQAEEQ